MSTGDPPPRGSLADQLIELSPQGLDPDSEAWAHVFAQHARKARRLRRLMRTASQ